jgi:two-component system, OmpR family, sensor histidine kinase ChvG
MLAEMRAQLIRAKAESLVTQGALISNILAETATTGEPEPRIIGWAARDVLRRIRVPAATTVKLYRPEGEMVADSDVLSDRVAEFPLPPLRTAEEPLGSLLPEGLGAATVLPWRPDFTLEEAIAAAAQGKIQSGERLDESGERIVSVSLPVQHVEAVVGVLTLESGDVENILAAERRAMVPFIVGAGVVFLLSTVGLAIQIARPLRNLSVAADRLRLGVTNQLEAPPTLMSRKDEIGDLAQALQRMTGALLERIDANARFAADVSHEIKNPLTSIRSAVETAQNVSNPDARERLLKIISADVGRVDRLITDISLASRIEAETARGAPVRVDMKRLLGDLVETYEATRKEQSAAVRLRVAPGAPTVVVGQDDPLGQVFRNLIDNARSFSPAGGEVLITIMEGARKDPRMVRILVEDQGPGIPPENLETVFRRFYTDRPKGSAFGGNSGLGLSIARQIVDAHKGRIWAENIVQGEQVAGARFVVELPAVIASGA